MKLRNLAACLGVLFFAVGCGRTDLTDSGVFASSESDDHYIVIDDQKTFLKKSTEDSTKLADGSEKCTIAAGTKLQLQSAPSLSDNHYFVKTVDLLPNCGFHNGYVFRGHVAKTSLRSIFSSNMRAFLDVIAFAEGTNDTYNYTFGFRTFSSYAGHPRWLICSGGYCSDAAGRYQILSTTWDTVRRELSLPDFSPQSQDRAAVHLIKLRGGLDDVERIDGVNSFEDALYTVRNEWASLPHSPYGQPTKSVGLLWQKFREYKTRY